MRVYYLSEVITNRLEADLDTDIVDVQPVGGGDINEARLIRTQNGQLFFVKLNNGPHGHNILATEARGLDVLRDAVSGQLRIPQVIAGGAAGDTAYLLLEYIAKGPARVGFWETFGQGLADLHRQPQDHFGLDHDNFIGRLPQSNQQQEDWAGFYTSQRLMPQARMAYEKQLFDLRDVQQMERLCRRLPEIYPQEPAALLHGDLWNGNYLTGPEGEPVLIDPAVSCSHREMDLAMTHLFGGFPPEFYEAYHSAYPLEAGWEERLPIGQLYYLLAHLNMFGAGYLAGVKRIVKQF